MRKSQFFHTTSITFWTFPSVLAVSGRPDFFQIFWETFVRFKYTLTSHIIINKFFLQHFKTLYLRFYYNFSKNLRLLRFMTSKWSLHYWKTVSSTINQPLKANLRVGVTKRRGVPKGCTVGDAQSRYLITTHIVVDYDEFIMLSNSYGVQMSCWIYLHFGQYFQQYTIWIFLAQFHNSQFLIYHKKMTSFMIKWPTYLLTSLYKRWEVNVII